MNIFEVIFWKNQILKSYFLSWSTLRSTLVDFLETIYMYVLPKNFAVVTFVLLSLYLTFLVPIHFLDFDYQTSSVNLGNICWLNVDQTFFTKTSIQNRTFLALIVFSYLPPFPSYLHFSEKNYLPSHLCYDASCKILVFQECFLSRRTFL